MKSYVCLLFLSAVMIALACQPPDCDRVDCGSCGKLQMGGGRGGGVSATMIALACQPPDCDREDCGRLTW